MEKNRSLKQNGGIIATLIILVILSSQIAKAQKDEGVLWFGVLYNNITVLGLPESFRNVPIHKKDAYGSPGIIEKEDYSRPWTLSVDYRQYFWESKRGLKIGFDIITVIGLNKFQRRNYTNAIGTAQRGYGAALTFCGLSAYGPISAFTGIKPLLPSLGFMPGITAEKSIKSSGTSIVINLSYQALSAIRGWDRYDALQSDRLKVIAHTFPFDLGLKFSEKSLIKGSCELGMRFTVLAKTSFGKEASGIRNPIGLYFKIAEAGY